MYVTVVMSMATELSPSMLPKTSAISSLRLRSYSPSSLMSRVEELSHDGYLPSSGPGLSLAEMCIGRSLKMRSRRIR